MFVHSGMPDSLFQPNYDLSPLSGAVVLINASISTKNILGKVITVYIRVLFESEGGCYC